jgi:iron complex outermembrane receptor protein
MNTSNPESSARQVRAFVRACTSLACVVLMGPPEAWSQSVDGLQEIVVTAQKREESLQSVPMSIAAFTGESLEQQGIFDLKTLSERTPGLFIGTQKPGQSNFYIRGVGSNDRGASADRAVPLYIDEQYIPRMSGQVVDLFDLERVEVLRGPQGTLFGRNATGGAVHLITRKPTETPAARVEATVGNLNAVGLQGYVSGPLAGGLMGKVSASSTRRDGYVESVMANYPAVANQANPQNLANVRAMNLNSESVRAALRYVAGENLELNFSATRATRSETGTMRHFVPGPGIGGSFYSTDSKLIAGYDNNFQKTIHDDPGIANVSNTLASFRADYRFGSGISLTSLTTYQSGEISVDDTLATPNMAKLRLRTGAVATTFIGNNPNYEENETWSQELRLSSAPGSRLNWVVGVYFLDESVDRNETAALGIVRADAAGNLVDVVPVSRGGEYQEARSKSYAAFGQGTYSVTDRLRLTLGARYTRDDKDQDVVGTAGGLVVISSYAGQSSKSWSKVTPKFAVDFDVADGVMLYALASNGFKSGGWQGLAPNGPSALTPYEPELAWLYEAGAKTEWLDKRLRVNLSLFQTKYDDMQILQSLIPENAPPNVVAVVYVTNAASSEIRGAELEVEAAPTENLFLSANYSYLDTEFSDFSVPPGFRPGAGSLPASSRVGKELPRAPNHTGSALARYTQPLANGGSLALQGSWRYVGRAFGDVDNLAFGATPAYDVVDARVTYAFPGEAWSVSVWGNNLLDEDYYLNNFPNLGSGWGTPAPPRTYGITFNWQM